MHVSHKHSFTLNLPLKHWIHFLLSSLWPPTSNILKEKKNTSCRMRNVSLLWTDEDLTLPNSNTVVVISTAQSLIRLTESWLCPLEIASQKSLMLTLCSEASPERRKIEKKCSFLESSFLSWSFSSRKAEKVPGLLEYSRFVLLHQSGQESCKDTNEEKANHFTHLGVYFIHDQTTVMFWTIYNISLQYCSIVVVFLSCHLCLPRLHLFDKKIQ